MSKDKLQLSCSSGILHFFNKEPSYVIGDEVSVKV